MNIFRNNVSKNYLRAHLQVYIYGPKHLNIYLKIHNCTPEYDFTNHKKITILNPRMASKKSSFVIRICYLKIYDYILTYGHEYTIYRSSIIDLHIDSKNRL